MVSASRLRPIVTMAVIAAAVCGTTVWLRNVPARALRRAFAAWSRGEGSIYDLMDDEAEVVIAGSTAHGGAYRKAAFLREVAGPFTARFAAPPRPRLRALWANGPQVVVLADADGTTRDRRPYANTYVFIFETARGRVTKVTEFLDMAAFEAVWDRAEPGSPHGA